MSADAVVHNCHKSGKINAKNSFELSRVLVVTLIINSGNSIKARNEQIFKSGNQSKKWSNKKMNKHALLMLLPLLKTAIECTA